MQVRLYSLVHDTDFEYDEEELYELCIDEFFKIFEPKEERIPDEPPTWTRMLRVSKHSFKKFHKCARNRSPVENLNGFWIIFPDI
jgi:hypothetical protein